MSENSDKLVLGAILLITTLTDLRRREVPCCLTFGGIATGVFIAVMKGPDALIVSLLGLMVGGLIVLPLVLVGAFGAADALLLAAIGAWEGPVFVLWTAWWTSLAGAVLAILVWRRGQTIFPYVPAISIGAVLTVVGTWAHHQSIWKY